MTTTPTILMTRPEAFAVNYVINPWMSPKDWDRAPESLLKKAICQWSLLRDSLMASGVNILEIPAVAGLPDLVFPANAAVVLDGRALMSRFARKERRAEEPVFRAYLENLCDQGILQECAVFPSNLIQEGAGDCLWDQHRELFWMGYGQRSEREAADAISDHFGCYVEALELIDPRFYHLDVAMAVLDRGEIMYYPDAFSELSKRIIRSRIPEHQLIEVSLTEASAFNVNAVSLNNTIFQNSANEILGKKLVSRGYEVKGFDLSPFLLAGGGAACLTLRLDYRSKHYRNVEKIRN